METPALLLLLVTVLATATTPMVQAEQQVVTLQADVPLNGELLEIGRTVRYHLHGLNPSSHFEVRVSYPAVVRARAPARVGWSRFCKIVDWPSMSAS